MKERFNILKHFQELTEMPGRIIEALKCVSVEDCHSQNGDDTDEVQVFTPALFKQLKSALQGNGLLKSDYEGVLSSDEALTHDNFPFVNEDTEQRPDLVFTTTDDYPLFLAEIKMSQNPNAINDLLKLTSYRKNINASFYDLYFIYVNMTMEGLVTKIKESGLNKDDVYGNIVCFCLNNGVVEHAELKNLFIP